MRYKLILVLLTISFQIKAQETEIVKINRTIDSIDYIINQKNEEIRLLVEKKNALSSLKNKILIDNQVGETYVCILGTCIYETPKQNKMLARLKGGDKVKLLETQDNLYKVFFNGITGWTLKTGFESDFEIQKKDAAAKQILIIKDKVEQEKILRGKQIEEERIANEKKIKQENRIAQTKRKNDLIIKYGQDIGLKIFDGLVWIGMTKSMLIDSRGRPKDINRTVGSWGVHEQWIYTGIYIYLENDIVTSWQD
ncbi:MAG TPA: hypothetical protein VMW01_13265 [Williamwhitmania sp.]|nr:hypothetical protein [Williamwhitmania sp.]